MCNCNLTDFFFNKKIFSHSIKQLGESHVLIMHDSALWFVWILEEYSS